MVGPSIAVRACWLESRDATDRTGGDCVSSIRVVSRPGAHFSTRFFGTRQRNCDSDAGGIFLAEQCHGDPHCKSAPGVVHFRPNPRPFAAPRHALSFQQIFRKESGMVQATPPYSELERQTV